jgi:hypothetical protein
MEVCNIHGTYKFFSRIKSCLFAVFLVYHFIYACSLFVVPGCKDGYCPAIYKPYLAFADDGNQYAVGEEILYMAIDSVLYFFLIIMIEYGVFGMLYEELRKKLFGNRVESQVLDDDVVHEQDRVDGQIQGIFSTHLCHFLFIVKYIFHV